MRFKDKVAVVIGGNSGIGLASAKAFAGEGAKVIITGRDAQTLSAAAIEIGHDAQTFQLDICRLQQIEAVMRFIHRDYGRIDILFVCAGVGAFVPIESVTEAMWDDVLNVNLKGLYFTIQNALAFMPHGSCIVLASSVAHHMGWPGNSVYAASKAAVRSLGRTLGAELLGRGIRVNVVSPGATKTPAHERAIGITPAIVQQMADASPAKRLGSPEEIAGAVLYLASDSASFITGTELLVDGGMVNC